MTSAETLEKKQLQPSIWMSNITGKRPDLSEHWTHEKILNMELNDGLDPLCSNCEAKARCLPSWITSYLVEIGQFT